MRDDATRFYRGNDTNTPLSGFTINDIKPGDVIRSLRDFKNRITAIQLLFETDNTGDFRASGTNYDSSYRTIYGRAYKLNGNVLEVSYDADMTKEDVTESFVLTGLPIFEVRDRKVYKTVAEEIITYKPGDQTELADKLFIFSSRSKAQILVFVR